MILQLAMQCAPNVAPLTVAAIVATESRGKPYALNVNGARPPLPQRSAAAAAATAQRYVAAGYSVDVGLGQINSRNMRKLGLTWRAIFDPCINIAALGRILTANYETALAGRHPQGALRIAFSLYNTGSPRRGFHNGYVRKVVGNARIVDPTVTPAQPDDQSIDANRPVVPVDATAQETANFESEPPTWNLFERAAAARQAQRTVMDRRNVWAR